MHEAKLKTEDALINGDTASPGFESLDGVFERRLVEASENYIRREHILSHLKTVYVA